MIPGGNLPPTVDIPPLVETDRGRFLLGAKLSIFWKLFEQLEINYKACPAALFTGGRNGAVIHLDETPGGG